MSPEGEPVRWEVEESSGYDRLDEAALSAVERWRFEPARRGGRSVEAEVVVPMEFQLR